MSLTVTIKYGDIITIGDAIITIDKYRGNQVRVSVEAPKELRVERIHRDKKYVEIKEKKNDIS
jgi:sRNA-binding carbon storage regulator CsrA